MIPVEVFSRDTKVDEAMHDYVTTRASKLDRYMTTIEHARVDLALRPSARVAAERFKAQITVRGKGFELRSEERGDQAQTAFDVALDKIERQIGRYKGKHSLGKHDKTKLAGGSNVEEPDQEDERSLIQRQKKFLLQPMDSYEAIEQMKLLGHENFFIFYNMDKGCVSVLYRRGDETYGLIDTELA